jgi:glycolate oxidase iron-sulfur subunit
MSASLPAGVRFLGAEPGAVPGWRSLDAPTDHDIAACVGCGLCLPHCPTFRLTGDETASPRGRIGAMRAVSEGRAGVDATFARFMDLCLGCRACEDVCPSHVPYGRMIDAARAQVMPTRPAASRLARNVGLDVLLDHPSLITLLTAYIPLVRLFLPTRVRRLVPHVSLRELARPLPSVTMPVGPMRGTVAVLTGCIQDRWFRSVNRATIRVLARNGWRVIVPDQGCCGALTAHFGTLSAARRMARKNAAAFAVADADWIVVNAAGCSAQMKEYGELVGAPEIASRVRDLLEFLDEQGFDPPPGSPFDRVALHDPCHLLHAQRILAAPRSVLGQVPGLDVVEIVDGDRCCGSAGLYNIFEPTGADQLMRQKAANVAATGCPVVLAGNPGCAVQIAAGLAELGAAVEVLHPAELLDRAYQCAR